MVIAAKEHEQAIERKLIEEEDCNYDLPCINFMDPASIRAVGAFNQCVFGFGREKFDGFQKLFVSAFIAVVFGVLLVLLLIFEEK